MFNRSVLFRSASLLITCGVVLAGCVRIRLPFITPAEAVLAGTWELIQGEDLQLGETLWIFDEAGNLVELRTTIGPVTVTEKALVSSTDVTGDDVVVQLGFRGNVMSFRGTLNPERTRAEGSLSTEITLFATTITIDGGPAMLVKRTE